MAGPAESPDGTVRPLVALGLATVTFVALLVFALGMVSLVLNADIVEAPGLGQLPGVFATAASTVVFAIVLLMVLRTDRPRYRGAVTAAVVCFLTYVIVIWLGVLVASAQLSIAGAVAGRIATTWFGAAVAVAAGLAAAGGIALARTHSQRPRWPWEDEFDE